VSTSAWELADYDGIGQAELIRSGQVSARELAQAALERIEQVDPLLCSVVWLMQDLDSQLDQLTPDRHGAPLSGVPTLLKDLGADYAGAPERCGSRFTTDFVPDGDSELVARMQRAGLVIVGKSSTSEFGNANEVTLPGPTHNPWNRALSTGGSSAGAGAAVAARLVPLAHGSDGGGSIRWPAAWCGLFGLKPTRGRNPFGPHGSEGCAGLPVAHVLSWSVRDSAAALDALSGPDVGAPFRAPEPERPFLADLPRPPGQLRIGYCLQAPDRRPVDDDSRAAAALAARLCEELGHIVEPAEPVYDVPGIVREFEALTWDSNAANIDAWEQRLRRKATEDDIEPLTWMLTARGRRRSASDHINSVNRLRRISREAVRFFEDYDLFLTPTNPSAARPHAELTPTAANVDEVWERELGGGIFLLLGNISGHPAMSVPLYWSAAGLPVGSHFMARHGREDVLLRLAAQLEQACAWGSRRPLLPGAAQTPAATATGP